MRIAVSNIAWAAADETEVADLLARLDVGAVEIAPTKVFADPINVPADRLRDYRAFWADRGIEIVAFQSLLFGRPDLELFGEDASRRALIDHVTGFLVLAGRLGASALVFGSPANRRLPPGRTEEDVWPVAVEAFAELGRRAVDEGTVLCIEPNPTAYSCDFIVDAASGDRLVRDVGSTGFRLHLDAAGMHLAGDAAADAIQRSADILYHFHASSPQLAPLNPEAVGLDSSIAALRQHGYDRVISIEMCAGAEGEGVARVDEAIARLRDSAAQVGIVL